MQEREKSKVGLHYQRVARSLRDSVTLGVLWYVCGGMGTHTGLWGSLN